VNEREQKQIIAILDREEEAAKRRYEGLFDQTLTHFGKSGMAGSSRMLDVSIKHMSDVLRRAITDMATYAGAVNCSVEAAKLVSEAIGRLIEHLSGRVPEAMLASRTNPARPLEGARAQTLFQTVRNEAERDLQIALFSFTGGSICASEQAAVAPKEPSAKTGRPLAKHWDSVWAITAAALYNGDLQPQNQADLERFMAQWLSDQGVETAPSTVRTRARALWDAIQLSN
jgi:hypothetical protein